MPKLDSPEAVDAEIQRELYKLELLGQRLTELRLMKHGYYTPQNEYVPGADFEYAESYDEQVRTLYYDCNDLEKPKDQRPKWPGEDVRASIVAKDIPLEKRQHKAALDGEIKSLTEYRLITSDRLSGLQSLLGYRKEEAKAAAQSG